MSEFKRENRYLVIKLSDASACLEENEMIAIRDISQKISNHREASGKCILECVVVESDWDEYEYVWSIIESSQYSVHLEKQSKICSKIREESIHNAKSALGINTD